MSTEVSVTCGVCGQSFQVSASRIKHGRGKHCSRSCQYESNKVPSHLKAKRKPRTPVARTPRAPRPSRVAKVEITCSTCGVMFLRKPELRVSRHAGEYCSRPCHYKGRGLGHTKRIVEDGYNLSDKVRADQSARSAHDYATGTRFPIPETEIKVSAALVSLGVDHVHQHVIDLGHRSVCVDLFFRDQMLVVEIDEHSLHHKPKFRRKDELRDAELTDAGYTVRRVLDDRDVDAITRRVLAEVG